MLYRLSGDINIVIIIELSNSLAFFITLFEYLRNLNKDFKYLWEDEHYEEVREGMSDDSADSYDWRYYNDGLDMDQQDERFWNF